MEIFKHLAPSVALPIRRQVVVLKFFHFFRALLPFVLKLAEKKKTM